MKAYCLNKISEVALKTIATPDAMVGALEDADSILVRSQAMHEMVLPKNVLAVARAGAGVNNIPLEAYAEEGIVVFNTPGANANAVKELTLCGMFLAARDVLGGHQYLTEHREDEAIAKTVEKIKSNYAGTEISGKKLGVIGLGVIGVLVANAAVQLGMEVYGYDPYLSITNAMKLSKNVHYVNKVEELYRISDYITLHLPLLPTTKNMVDASAFAKMKKGTVLLNFSRGGLVDQKALKESLEDRTVAKYVTDFPDYELNQMAHVIAIPHLGASTEEAEDNCAFMAIKQLKDYLENGNIINSVNYPTCDAGNKGDAIRLAINHHNVVGMLANFSQAISEQGGNIISMVNKSLEKYAYTVIDIEKKAGLEILAQKMEALEGVLKVRILV